MKKTYINKKGEVKVYEYNFDYKEYRARKKKTQEILANYNKLL